MATLLFSTEVQQKKYSLSKLKSLILGESESLDNELNETIGHLTIIENSQNEWFKRTMSYANGEDRQFIEAGGFDIEQLPELSKIELEKAIDVAYMQVDDAFSGDGDGDDPHDPYKTGALLRAKLRAPTISQLYTQKYATKLQHKQQPDIAHILHIMERKERVEITTKLGSRGFSVKKLISYGTAYGMLEVTFYGMDLIYGTLSPEIQLLFDFVNGIRSIIRLTCVPVLVQDILPGSSAPDKNEWRILREVAASMTRLSSLRVPVWLVGLIGNPFTGSVVGTILFTGVIGALTTTILHSVVNKVILYDEEEFAKKISEDVLEEEKRAASLKMDLNRAATGFMLSDLPETSKILEYRDSLFAKYSADGIQLMVGASCGYAIATISMENSGLGSLVEGDVLDGVFGSAADMILFQHMAIPAAIRLSSTLFGDIYREHLKKYATTTYNKLLPEKIRAVLDKYIVQSYTDTMGMFMYYLYASIGGMWLGGAVFNAEGARHLVQSLRTESYQVSPIVSAQDDPELLHMVFGRTVSQEALKTYITPLQLDENAMLDDFRVWEALHLNKQRIASVDLDRLAAHFTKVPPVLKGNISIAAADTHTLNELVLTKFPDALIGNHIQKITETDYASISDVDLADFTKYFGRVVAGVSWEDFVRMRQERRNTDSVDTSDLWNMFHSADETNNAAWTLINQQLSEGLAATFTYKTTGDGAGTSTGTSTSSAPPPPTIAPADPSTIQWDAPIPVHATPVVSAVENVYILPEVREGLSTTVVQATRQTTIMMQSLLPEIAHSLQKKTVITKSLALYMDMFWGSVTSHTESLFLSFRTFFAKSEYANSMIQELEESLEKNMSQSCLAAYGTGGVRLGVNENGEQVPITATGEDLHKDCYMYPPVYTIATHLLSAGTTFFTYGPGLLFYLKFKFLILPFEMIFNTGVIRDAAATARLIRLSALDLLQGGYYEPGSLSEGFVKLAIAYSCAGESSVQGSVCSEYTMYFNPVQAMKGVDIFKIFEMLEPFTNLKGSENMSILEYITNTVSGVMTLFGPDTVSEMIAGTPDMSTVSDVGRLISDNMQTNANFAGDLIGFLKDMFLRFMVNATFRY